MDSITRCFRLSTLAKYQLGIAADTHNLPMSDLIKQLIQNHDVESEDLMTVGGVEAMGSSISIRMDAVDCTKLKAIAERAGCSTSRALTRLVMFYMVDGEDLDQTHQLLARIPKTLKRAEADKQRKTIRVPLTVGLYNSLRKIAQEEGHASVEAYLAFLAELVVDEGE
jgi:hypothetical protein